MKSKHFFLIILMLRIYHGNSQNILQNPGFETPLFLTGCFPPGPVNNCSAWNSVFNSTTSCNMYIGTYSGGTYWNNSPGGNGACMPIQPRNQSKGFISVNTENYYNGDQFKEQEFAYQLIPTICYPNKKYKARAYIKASNGWNISNPTTKVGICFINTTSATSATNLLSAINAQQYVAPVFTNDPSGWIKIERDWTPPTQGSYLMVIGILNSCINSPEFPQWLTLHIDDVSLELYCDANAGPDQTNLSKPGCNPSCSSIQIGTPPINGFSYIWSPNNGTLSNPTSAQTNASPCSTTNYTLTVSNNSGACLTNTDIVKVTTLPGSGCIPGGAKESLIGDSNIQSSIYPNPYSSLAIITIDRNLDNASVFIYDLTGALIKSHTNLSGSHLVIDRVDLKAGLYIYKVMENSLELANGKFVIID